MRRAARPVHPDQLARWGDVALKIRTAVQAKGWNVPKLNDQMGLGRTHGPTYNWLRGVSGPGPKMRKRLANALGIKEADLMPNENAADSPGQDLIPYQSPVSKKPSTSGPIKFEIFGNGEARLQLDMTLSLGKAQELMNHVLGNGYLCNNATRSTPAGSD